MFSLHDENFECIFCYHFISGPVFDEYDCTYLLAACITIAECRHYWVSDMTQSTSHYLICVLSKLCIMMTDAYVMSILFCSSPHLWRHFIRWWYPFKSNFGILKASPSIQLIGLSSSSLSIQMVSKHWRELYHIEKSKCIIKIEDQWKP